ncbi:lachesin-like [Zootermopsis nevadensis]|nr:lachesin-like [Zootermopsis nevadensis]
MYCTWCAMVRIRRGLVWWPLLIILGWCAGLQDHGFDLGSAVPPHSHALTSDVDPDFNEPIKNVTVPVGREAILSCLVTELGHYKVGWMKAEDQTILTLHNKVVTHNSRISVTHDNHRTWQLHIRQVKESDRGCYMCQINTNVMKKQVGCVDVHVPPDITDEETSSDLTVREGENATMMCRATGHPVPRILWRREDGEGLILRKGLRDVTKVDTFSGDTLTLVKLDRRQMGAYLCIASNDVPPAVSKRITLNVNFAPVVKVPNQLLGAPLGTNVSLECHVEAFPNTINYWLKNRGEMLLDGTKHSIVENRTAYKVHLKLTINQFSSRDLGTYMCVSTNSLGHAEGTVRLYEIKVATPLPIGSTENQVVTVSVPEVEVTGAGGLNDAANDIIHTTIAPMQSMMEESVLDQSSTMQDVQAERGVNSGAQRGAACRVLATFMAPFLSVLVHVVR